MKRKSKTVRLLVNFFNAGAYAAYDEMICRLAEDGLLLTPVAKPRLIERLEFRTDLPRGQKKLASMGWHCITVWECELKPAKREETLDSIAFTLNHIWLQDHGAKAIIYPNEETDPPIPMAAEDSAFP